MTIVIMGKKSADIIGKVINEGFDNAEVLKYNTISSFWEDTSTRGIFFERLLITPDLFDSINEHEEEVVGLCDYLSSNYPEVRIITISKTEETYALYNKIFTSPLNLNVAMTSMSATKVAELVATPIEKLRAMYSDASAVAMQMAKVDKTKVAQNNAPKKVKPAKEKKKKKGLFGGLFGGGKSDGVEYVLDDGQGEAPKPKKQTKMKMAEIPRDEVEESKAEMESAETEEQPQEQEQEVQQGRVGTYFDDDEPDTAEDEPEIEDVVEVAPVVEEVEEPKKTIPVRKKQTIKPKVTTKEVNVSAVASKLNAGGIEQLDTDDEDAEGEVIDFTSGRTVQEVEEPVIEDISAEVEEVESAVQELVTNATPSVTVDDVEGVGDNPFDADIDDDLTFEDDGIEFGDINQLEEDYQVGSGKAKVIEKERIVEKVVEVEKVIEKPVYVKGDKKSASKLQLVTKGIENITIVVTGDRRSGVTTLATRLASMFAQKLKVLYVDMDTKRRGSLLHVGINQLMNEDDTVQRGLELVKSAKMLQHMVYTSSAVKFDTLLSVGDEDVTDAQLEIVGDVIMLQDAYNVTIVDCPFEKLHLINDITSVYPVIVCLEEDISAIKNTAQFFEGMDLPAKYKRILFNNMHYCITRGAKNSYPALFQQVNDFFETDDDLNWSDVKKVAGVVADNKGLIKLMENILV